MIDDSILFDWYERGWDDEMSSAKNRLVRSDPMSLRKRAYNLGRIHAELGDDLRSFDYLPAEKILKLIKQ